MLRHLDTHEVDQGGQRGLVLIDPVGIASGQIFVPEALLPIVSRFDGTRTTDSIQEELARELGDDVPDGFVAGLVRDLDEALVLHSKRFDAELGRRVDSFCSASSRPAASCRTGPTAC